MFNLQIACTLGFSQKSLRCSPVLSSPKIMDPRDGRMVMLGKEFIHVSTVDIFSSEHDAQFSCDS
jgi:hypothetical protein